MMGPFVLFDTETTGLPDDPNARVIEIGAAIFVPPAVDPLRTFTSFVKPDVLTDEGRVIVEAISHIDPDILLTAPPPELVSYWLRAFVGDLPFLAFNMGFDRPMLLRGLPDCAPLFENPVLVGEAAAWRKEPSCVMEAFIERFRIMTRTHPGDERPTFFSLARAADLAGVEFQGNAHRALTDAVVGGQIFLRLLDGLAPPEMPLSPVIRASSSDERLRQLVPKIRAGFMPTSPILRGGQATLAPKILGGTTTSLPKIAAAGTALLPKIRVSPRASE